MNPVTKVQQRPAETGGLAGAVALLIVYLLGITDPAVIVAIGVIVASIPAVITWIVATARKH